VSRVTQVAPRVTLVVARMTQVAVRLTQVAASVSKQIFKGQIFFSFVYKDTLFSCYIR